MAPDFLGHGSGPAWLGSPADILTADVSRVVALAGDGAQRIHLVGHSYGGAVALRAAMLHPDRFTSVTVYEPVVFRALRELAPQAREAGEVADIGAAVRRDLRSGANTTAARRFVDYWSGSRRFDAMTAYQQQSIAARMPAVGAHFTALWSDWARPADYARIRAPLTVLMGSQTRAPARRIVELLRLAMPYARFDTLAGFGHLAPMSHAEAVAHHIGAGIRDHERRMAAAATGLAA